MDSSLSAEDSGWLQKLATDDPVKPELPAAVAERFIEQGLAIKLVEGGLQLTKLGRDKLLQA